MINQANMSLKDFFDANTDYKIELTQSSILQDNTFKNLYGTLASAVFIRNSYTVFYSMNSAFDEDFPA